MYLKFNSYVLNIFYIMFEHSFNDLIDVNMIESTLKSQLEYFKV